MKYEVKSRNDWDAALQYQFGDHGSVHELSDAEVVAAIIKHGRAEIIENDPNIILSAQRLISFQNDYD